MSLVSLVTVPAQDESPTETAGSLNAPPRETDPSTANWPMHYPSMMYHPSSPVELSSQAHSERLTTTSFQPEPLTVRAEFSIIPRDGQTILNNLPSHAPNVPPIYQELGAQVARHQGYDVDVCRFLENWSLNSHLSKDSGATSQVVPGKHARQAESWARPTHIDAGDVTGNKCDMQGIDWTSLGTTRAFARKARAIYCEAVHCDFQHDGARAARNGEMRSRESQMYKFRRMNTKHRVWIEHAQLRNLISVNSHNDIFYASGGKVLRTDPLGGSAWTTMDLTATSIRESDRGTFASTAMSSSEDMVVVGSYESEYAMKTMDSECEAQPTTGLVFEDRHAIICHVELFRCRGIGRPSSAAFSCNNRCLRILDCATNKFTSTFPHSYPLNCSATDPNGQMRLVVGDSSTACVTNATSGEVIKELKHHAGNIFAASWSDNGIHMATGADDRRVFVYDARNWSQPVATIVCETAPPQSVKFSPLGGGSPVLLIAEAEDSVIAVDANGGLFARKQTIDFFGTVAGIDWRPDGRAFWVANGDTKFGGLMEFERANRRNEEDEVVGHDFGLKREQRVANQRKRASWQISSHGDNNRQSDRANLAKRRSFASNLGSTIPQSDDGPAASDDRSDLGTRGKEGRQQYAERVGQEGESYRARTLPPGRSSRKGLALGQIII